MAKRLEEKLSETALDVLKSLKTGKKWALTIDEIEEVLEKETGEKVSKNRIYKELSNLMKYGSVRSANFEGSKGEERAYYLSRGLGSGRRNYNRLAGKATFTDIGKYISRIFGGIFVLFGIGFLVYQNLPLSGAVISNNPIVKDINLIFPSILVVIGAALIFLSGSKKSR